jgi:glycosyltransferase involved in cell wall biosynthesis
MSKKRVIFISTGGPGHASEELWWRTAIRLAQQGYAIVASVAGWPLNHERVERLEEAGIYVQSRPERYSLWKRGWHHIFHKSKHKAVLEVQRLLRTNSPNLIIFSEGYTYPPVELLELSVSRRIPFVTIANGNFEHSWPDDDGAERYRNAFSAALRCYFVSNATLRLTEKQIGCQLPNAEVVWSQYNVDFNSSPSWPVDSPLDKLLLACVGRLDPAAKGQDILLEALAGEVWRDRAWHLALYGDGSKRDSLQRLTARLGLSDRVTFAGYSTVEKIWSTNHVLVMASRHEGLPLAMVEAMLCGRPVLATDVAGHSEIILDGVTGFLMGAPTVTNVKEGLEKLWASREALGQMGRAGAKRIREIAPADPIRLFSEKIERLI